MRSWRVFLRSLIAVLLSSGIVGLCSLVLVLLRDPLGLSTSVVALLYLIPVVISAVLWGRLPGITASVLSFLIFNYFFLSPFLTFQVAHPQDFLAMIVLLGVAVLISSLVARIQSNLAQVRTREREAVQLYELSMDLAGKNDERSIARALVQRLARLLPTARITVTVTTTERMISETASGTAYPPAGAEAVDGEEAGYIVEALISPHGKLGEMFIWNAAGQLSPEEGRLLRTFSSQGTLALDRAILAASETRARVLEESDRLKTAILSSVSHELRTPLASIEAAATSLFNPRVALEPAARAELQSLLLEETETLTQLVGNLLNMSRIEAGALKLQRQWNGLDEIVDSAIRRLRRVTTRHTIEVALPDDLPLVAVDAVLMEQVVINLVRNSLRFAPPETPIHIRAEVGERWLTVVVSNQGPRIPAAYLDHLFEKFYPIPGRDPAHGTGLGLSICKGIVEAHGGNIWAENLPVGVAFHFSLPLDWQGILPVLPDRESEDG